MTMDESEKQLKELLSKGATEEEILKKLTLAEGCGLKLWCQEQIIPASGKKLHRYCGYIKKRDDPAENIAEPICTNGWMEDVKGRDWYGGYNSYISNAAPL